MKIYIHHLLFLFFFVKPFQTLASFSDNTHHAIVMKSSKYISGNLIEEEWKHSYSRELNRKEFLKLQEFLGAISPPFASIDHQKKINSKLFYKVHYNTSDYGFRYFQKKSNASRHVIVAGDSNVFAEGVDDSLTMTEILNKSIPDVQIYNFGQRGAAPNNTLSFLEHFPFENLIKEPSGVFLYNFFPGHMFERVIGSKNVSCWDSGRSPEYKLNDQGIAEFRGRFLDRTFIQFFYKVICTSDFLNTLIKDLPQVTESDSQLIAQIFLKMKTFYLEKFPQSQFYVIINRAYFEEDSAATKSLLTELSRLKVNFLSMPNIIDKSKCFFPLDSHLNIEGQKFEAVYMEKLILDIFSKNKKNPIGAFK